MSASWWSLQHVELKGLDFQLDSFCSAYYERTLAFKQVLDLCDAWMKFKQGWGYVIDRFKQHTIQNKFCGGLATAFLGTSTLECNFSNVKNQEKNYC